MTSHPFIGYGIGGNYLGDGIFFIFFLRIYLIDKMYRVALLTDEFRLGFQQGWNWRVYRQVGRMAGQRSD